MLAFKIAVCGSLVFVRLNTTQFERPQLNMQIPLAFL